MNARRIVLQSIVAVAGIAAGNSIPAGNGIAAVAVDPALPGYTPGTEVSGELVCAGGETMRELAQRWADGFRRYHPNARIRVEDETLSADGFTALLEGRADCVTYVREPFRAELAAFEARFGFPPLLLNVAGGSYATRSGTHALAIYVNAGNPLSRLTLQQLDATFSSTLRRGAQGPVATWSDLGVRGARAARRVHVYGMLRLRATGNPPGIMNFLQQRVLLGGEFRNDLLEQSDRPGESALEAIVNRVAADPDGIGVSGFAFAKPGVKSLAIAESAGSPYFRGTRQEVALRHYPLSREMYLMVKRAPGEPIPPLLREFLRWTLSREGQQIVAADRMSFMPLRAAEARVARASVEAYVTRF